MAEETQKVITNLLIGGVKLRVDRIDIFLRNEESKRITVHCDGTIGRQKMYPQIKFDYIPDDETIEFLRNKFEKHLDDSKVEVDHILKRDNLTNKPQ